MVMSQRYITAVPARSTLRPTRSHVIAVNRVGGVLSVSTGAACVSVSPKSGYVVTPASDASLGCVSL